MNYIRTENGIEKYDVETQDTVKIENSIIVGSGNTIIAKTDPKYVYWEKFGKPSSLKEYGIKALEIAHKLYMMNYELTDGVNTVYYNAASNILTTVAGDNPIAVLDVYDESSLEANLRSDGNAILKGINKLVGCGDVTSSSIISTGKIARNDCLRNLNSAISLINNHDADQDLEVFNLIKDEVLTKANFNALCLIIEGAK